MKTKRMILTGTTAIIRTVCWMIPNILSFNEDHPRLYHSSIPSTPLEEEYYIYTIYGMLPILTNSSFMEKKC
jgi:hypothetical protein